MLRSNRGFSLVELLVAIAIIAILLGLLLPAVQKVRSTAARMQCQNNLKQIALAAHNYESPHGALPPGLTLPKVGETLPYIGWLARLLPYIEQDALWRQSLDAYAERPNTPFTLPHFGIMTPIKTFSCPADDRQSVAHDTHQGLRVATASYLGVNGTNYKAMNGALYPGSRVRLTDVADGTSNTLLAGERPPSPDFWYGWWYASGLVNGGGDTNLGVNELSIPFGNYTSGCPSGPYGYRNGKPTEMCDLFHFWSLHTGGANFALCDGSVRFLRYDAAQVLPALATRAGGEVVASPD